MTVSIVSDEILRAITPTGRKTKAGWIFPDGSVVPCSVMGHREVLPEKYRERYSEIVDDYQREMHSCLDALSEGEHPEMHRFDPEGDAARDVEEELAEDGYIRFGICEVYGPKNYLDIRCTKKSLRAHNILVAHIIAVLNIEIIEWTDPKSHYCGRHFLNSFGPSSSEGSRLEAIKKLR